MKKETEEIASRVAHEAFSSSWAIRQQSFERFCRSLFTKPAQASIFEDDEEGDDTKPKYHIENGVAVVPLVGVMMRNPGWLTYWGACDTDHFSDMIRKAVADPACIAIMLDIDSPGGSVIGTPEAAASVLDARAFKPVLAYSGGLMCSAAYWVASQAQAVYSSRSAIIGSIGCYVPIYDYSKWYVEMGISIDIVRSGKFKGGNVAGAPVSKDYRENMQQIVDGIGAAFRAEVKAQRPGVVDEMMEGQEFLGSDGVGSGLIDSVTSYERAVADAGALAAMRK